MTTLRKTDPSPRTRVHIPWGRVLAWEALFNATYLFRFVALEIWRASKMSDAVFEELKFGETPVSTVKTILEYLPPLGPDSLIYDLGCGRGKAAFAFHFLSGARILALDAVPTFVTTGRWLARRLGAESSLFFYWEDFRDSALEPADLIYACALCFGPETRRALLTKVLDNRPGCYLVTVGWKPEHPRLEAVARFEGRFSWGPCPVTICRLTREASGDDATLGIDDESPRPPQDRPTPE